MRAVVQRVSSASVAVDGVEQGAIDKGLMVLLGITLDDDANDVEWLCGKIARMRLFDNSDGVMDLPITEVNGDILLVSQFTLHASTKKGNRPSYIAAARPEQAIPLYEKCIKELETLLSKRISTGTFGAMMQVALVNDGPVTIIIDSKNRE